MYCICSDFFTSLQQLGHPRESPLMTATLVESLLSPPKIIPYSSPLLWIEGKSLFNSQHRRTYLHIPSVTKSHHRFMLSIH